MAFIYAAIVPHSPLLLETVGKEYRRQIRKTQKGIQGIKEELHAAHPEMVIVIHPHGTHVEGAVALNLCDEFTSDLSEFGDIVTKPTFHGAPTLAHALREHGENAGMPLTMISESAVSYDVTVPLLLLQTSHPWSVLPISPMNHDLQAHVNIGKLIAETLHAMPERIAVILSIELSHHTTAAAPKGERPEGIWFDHTIVRALTRERLADRLLDLDPNKVEQAESCGYQSLLIFAGMLARKHCSIQKLSYESPFGVGLLTAIVNPG
jgi:AmmeMemoRadiSam system protein B